MEDLQKIAWFAGLFEGEGTFGTVKGKAKLLALTSTDKDVLDRLVEYFGGKIYKSNHKNQKENWKQAYVWNLNGEKSINLAQKIIPYLLARRKEKGLQWLESYQETIKKMNDKKVQLLTRTADMISLRKQGLSHKKIGEQLGYERSSVTKILNMVGIA